MTKVEVEISKYRLERLPSELCFYLRFIGIRCFHTQMLRDFTSKLVSMFKNLCSCQSITLIHELTYGLDIDHYLVA